MPLFYPYQADVIAPHFFALFDLNSICPILSFTFQIIQSVVCYLDFFVEDIYGFLCLEHPFYQVIVLVYLFFELFYPVVAQLCCGKYSAQCSAERSDKAEQGDYYRF